MPLQRFGIVRDGEPIAAVPVRDSVRTGISYEDPRVYLGMVAEYEEREAAKFSGVPWPDWERTDPRDRAPMVAHYRMSSYVSLHANDAVTRASEARAKRRKAASR